MDVSGQGRYLEPYLRAVRQHGDGFRSLLWASPDTQAARFEALLRVCDFAGRSVLDAGCGRADLLDFLVERGAAPSHYIGLEAVEALARAADRKRRPRSQVVRGDFVREPHRLFAGAQIVVFCGALNTLAAEEFDATLRHGHQAAGLGLVFNFLCSSRLAGARWLTWHEPARVVGLARRLGGRVTVLDDYMDGDCTIAVWKETAA